MKKFIAILFALSIFMMTIISMAAENETDTVYSKGSTGMEIYIIQERLKNLGYLQYRPTGKYSDMTANAVRKFQQQNGITADGQVGNNTKAALFSEDAKRCSANPNFRKQIGISSDGSEKSFGILSSWEKINLLIPINTVFKLTDFNSGKSFNVIRTGGEGCAQIITATSDDYTIFLEIFGGETWEHRSVFADINGIQYAASLFGMPTNNKNYASEGNMNGHTFLYFQNSVSDINGLPDEEHLAAILKIGKDGVPQNNTSPIE